MHARDLLAVGLAICALTHSAHAQTRRLIRDSTRNNLAVPAGTPTTAPDRLGAVDRIGTGPRHVIWIPGAGFGSAAYRPFVDSLAAQLNLTVHVLTLAGFGGTPPWPMPAAGTPYQAGTWLAMGSRAVLQYMDSVGILSATVVDHWIVGTQVATRLALQQPRRVTGLILLAGVAKSNFAQTPGMLSWTLERRSQMAEGMGASWFKFVTEDTWHDNNFMPYDYAVSPLSGLLLWRRAVEPTLPTWIRYLLEFYATDLTTELGSLQTPTLRIEPALDDPAFFVDQGRNYVRDWVRDSWIGTDTLRVPLCRVLLSGARIFVTTDRPVEVLRLMAAAGVGREDRLVPPSDRCIPAPTAP